MDNTAQEKMLRVKSLLGKWEHPVSGKWWFIECKVEHPLETGRSYRVIESPRPYNKSNTFICTEHRTVKTVEKLKQDGYKLVEQTYPELKDYFRDGNPITAGDILSDAMDEMVVERTEFLSGLDALIASYK